jgi:TolB-like protein/DNA-binding SARP family transcriptional activator/Flp pilus assembly protein TadD
LELRILGGASLHGPAGPVGGRAAQRHRLALLALLALHPRLSREKAVAFLWPDAREERGRRLLSDSIYRIHRALGFEAVLAVGDELSLDAERLPCDAVSFRDAMRGDDFHRADALYAGPLLDGFFLPDAGAFERWSDRLRVEFAADHARAVEALAEAAEARGDLPEAIRWWRRAEGLDPLSTRVALRHIAVLALAGEDGAATRRAQAHVELVREELGTEPGPEIDALLSRIRETRGTVPLPVVSSVPRPHPAQGSGPVHAARPARAPAPRPTGARFGLLAAAAVVVLAGLFAGWFVTRPPVAAEDLGDLAVLAFVDLGPEGEHQYLADGMTEELIGILGGVEGLRVVGRTSVFALRNRGLDAREIGETLGVAAFVEGTVRLFDGRLRVSARLVSAETGYPVWSETYEREMADVLRMQADIAGAIAATLRGRLVAGGADPELPGRIDPDAYHRYLQGRFLWHRRTGPDLLRAAEVLEEAVVLAPSYARAHLALADAWAVLAFYDLLPPDEAFPLARDAAMRALELEPGLGAAHATLGYVDLYHAWDWPRAEEAFLRAIDLEPGLSQAYQWYANHLVAMGRFPEAEFAMLRAQEFDPLSLIANAALGWVHYYAAEYDRGVAQCRRTLEIDPGFGLAHLWLGQSLERLERFEEGVTALERAIVLSGGSAIARAALARMHAVRGDREAARALLSELVGEGETGYVPSYEIARVHEALEDPDAALAWLERAFSERAHSLVFLRVDPGLEGLRGRPEFEALAERVGLEAPLG